MHLQTMNFKDWTSSVLYLVVGSCLLLNFASCSGTRSITKASAFPRQIETASKSHRYFLMHSGVDVFHVSSVIVEKSKQHFTVQLNKPDSAHLINISSTGTINEKCIHVFMKDSTSYTLDEPHTILFSKISRIELANK
jgi:hypothetical protein